MHNERYSILYSSATGNTRLLADTIRAALPPELCDAFGAVGKTAAESELLYVGFWTDKGNADADTLALLRTLKNKRLFLFHHINYQILLIYFLPAVKHFLELESELLRIDLLSGMDSSSVAYLCHVV